jgi:hypothetical protein
LDDLVNSYNNSVHRTLRASPASVYSGSSKPAEVKLDLGVLDRLSSVKPGDKVRILENKGVFTKGTEPIWSSDVYSVTGREGNKFRLSNGRLVGVNQLLVVHDVQTGPMVRRPIRLKEEIQKVTRVKRIGEELKREGIEEKNIVSGIRVRRPVRMDL